MNINNIPYVTNENFMKQNRRASVGVVSLTPAYLAKPLTAEQQAKRDAHGAAIAKFFVQGV